MQVHPDLRVQALVEQVREREIAQMVGRLRLVHRTTPARVFLLSNVPTALPVDRLLPWAEAIPGKVERAIVAGHGVVPLSYSELARVHPDLWAASEDARNTHRKGGNIPISISYWNSTTLSAATLVTHRRPGQRRGSPHQAIVPSGVEVQAALEAVLGPVEEVRVVEQLRRPYSPPPAVIVDPGEPEPLAIPIAVTAPYHLIAVDEAWSFSGIEAQRWTLATGQAVLVPKPLWRCQLTLRGPGHPTAFARAAPT